MNLGITVGLVTAGLLTLLLLGIPIAYVLGMTGIFGLYSATGGTSAWLSLTSGAALHLSSSSLLAIPLFMLMSAYITESGSRRLCRFFDFVRFQRCNGWRYRRRGHSGISAART